MTAPGAHDGNRATPSDIRATAISARPPRDQRSLWPPRLAILAGGLATRLRPLTATLPKSLVRVAGEPFLAHQLRLVHSLGLREIVLCCGFLGDQIEAFARDGSRFGLSIAYSHDGDRPLGTGGALRAALPLLGSRFLVMYGDSWLTEPIEPMWRAFLDSGQPALMTVFRNENRWGASNVEFRGGSGANPAKVYPEATAAQAAFRRGKPHIANLARTQDRWFGSILRYDKRNPSSSMRHIDYGLNALEASVLARWTVPVFDLSEVWSGLAARSLLAGYQVTRRFYEIGSWDGMRATESAISVACARRLLKSALSQCGPPPQQEAQGGWS